MVDGISRVYANQIQPVKPAQSVEKKDSVKVERRKEGAGTLVPDLKDKVEISEEGRKASKTLNIDHRVSVDKENVDAIQDNWYSAGYRMAVEESDQV